MELSREIDSVKDKVSVLEENNSQLERYKEKYGRVGRELQKEIEFAQQRRAVASEEKVQAEIDRKRIRRIVLDEQEAVRIAQQTAEKLEEQLSHGRNELNLKRAQFVQDEREYETLGQNFTDTQADVIHHKKQGLAEPETLRIEKQCEGYKKSSRRRKGPCQSYSSCHESFGR